MTVHKKSAGKNNPFVSNPDSVIVNYPFAKDKWASGFTDLRFVTKVLFESPPV